MSSRISRISTVVTLTPVPASSLRRPLLSDQAADFEALQKGNPLPGHIADLVRATGTREVIKVKSLATDEIGMNEALEAEGIHALETDLAELIVQLGDDAPSHILVPAIHKNRAEIRKLFMEELGAKNLSDRPSDLTEAARLYLREKFLAADIGVTGANFGVAETGTICTVTNEGNARLVTSVPPVHVVVMGIEKLVPRFADLSVFVRLLARSSTGHLH